MASLNLKEFLKRNEESLENYQAPPLMRDLVNMIPESGTICIIEVTCSDARVDPRDYFGVELKALVIRNAGGRAVDAYRSLEVMGTIAPIGLIIVVHHTDCGAVFTTEEEIRSKLSHRAPVHAASIKDKWFGTFRDIGLDESIRQDMEELKRWPFLPAETQIVGYALDLETGTMREVA
ncbi:beta-carbonic anhydrase cab [Fusarium subglutinans]|uniref:Carbonic anhydrase n=1 Tax=Gibberella subglutinans TaxID=42677 RepID=A0A8H5NY82_GIBSU|nr:beta-carbonic anhydrase cab [Fusarium subglutinans]KAF5583012.1 beta-carbonic anhydrase cab [Fusarium subglutinans]